MLKDSIYAGLLLKEKLHSFSISRNANPKRLSQNW
ncbi:MAG: hypothetical protein ACI9U6_003338, partial [Loktanella salsilacus]